MDWAIVIVAALGLLGTLGGAVVGGMSAKTAAAEETNRLRVQLRDAERLSATPGRTAYGSTGRVDELGYRRLEAEIEATVRLPLGGGGRGRAGSIQGYR